MPTERATSNMETLLDQPQARRRTLRSRSGLLRRFLGHRMLVVGAIIVGAVLLVAICAPILTPYNPINISAGSRLLPPSRAHPFGTDEYGRDLFTRILYGARLSLLVGSSVMVLSMLFGIPLGMLAGFYRSMDAVIMRVMDALMALPSVLLALAVMAILGPGLVNGILALTVVYIPQTARIVRGVTLSVKEREYITAIRSIGAREPRILARHVLPNLLGVMLVQGSFIFAVAIQIEAALSFLGLGAAPPTPTWGNMLSAGRFYMQSAIWYVTAPGVALAITVLGLNLLGDGLRDALDPRAKQLMNRRREG